MSDGLCGALLWAAWDEFPIDVRCEREAGHIGDHSAERGEWGWAQNIAPAQGGDVLDDLWWEADK